MKRKILSVLLALCLVLGMLPGTARAEEGGTLDTGLTWTLNDDGTLTISGNGAMPDFDSASNRPWASSKDNIQAIVIQRGVTSIGNRAFYQCGNLTSITIPDSVTSIVNNAFSYCYSLTSVTIPDSVTFIDYHAFSNCTGLTIITIPASVTSIGFSAFENCRSLTSITIPDSVTSIGQRMFFGCTSLTSVTIPNSITSIEESMFQGCSGLTSITIPNSVTNIDRYAFSSCSSLTSVAFLGDGVSIDGIAFDAISDLTFRYPYGNTTWDGIIGNDYGATSATWKPYGPTTLTVSITDFSEDGSPCTLQVTSRNLPFDPDEGKNLDNYTLTQSAYSLASAEVDAENSNIVTLTLTKTSSLAARALDVSLDVAAAAFAAELTDANAVAIASVSQSFQLAEPSEEIPVEPDPTPDPIPDPDPDPDPDPIPSGTGTDQSSQPSTPSNPVSVAVDDELETGGPGEIVISGEGESDMQHILKPDEHIRWIDRVDLPQYATDLYTVLCIGGDHDTLYDILIKDEYNTVSSGAAGAAREEAEVESVLELVSDLNLPYSSGAGLFQGDEFTGGFDVIDTTAGDRAISYGDLKEGDVVRTSSYNGIFVTSIRKDGNDSYEEDKKAASTYASTAFQAFDRDHPEVFWLSGKNKLRLVTVTMKDGSQKYKETYIFFVLADADGFTVRDPLYPSQTDIESAIARRDAAVETILSTVTAAAPNEQAAQLNRWLTEHNHYNTSEDLYSLPNWPHECLSALEGNIGTNGPVCDGYARAFKVLCDRLEIPCVLVDGYALTKAGGPGEFHMWNSVQIDEQWYGVDVTWNDPTVRGIDGARSGYEREDFLLVGGDTVVFGLKFSESHPPKNRAVNGGVAFVNGPSLSAEAFNPLAGASVLPFTDVTPGSWYYSAVEYAYDHNLMTGETASSFAPDGFMTRAMVWTVLARMAGADVNGGTPWYAPAQTWAVNEEISDGSNPGGNISREELVTMLWRAQGRPDAAADLSGFTDSEAVSGWASGAVQWAVSTGLLEGSGGKINPSGRATRAEVAALLTRFCEASQA